MSPDSLRKYAGYVAVLVLLTALLHLVETGLLVVPDDFTARSSGFLPLFRED